MFSDDGGDFFKEGDDVPDEKPQWRPPVSCPRCYKADTRFLTLNYEISVYLCNICDVEFEVEE